jgi:hypothetical protein
VSQQVNSNGFKTHYAFLAIHLLNKSQKHSGHLIPAFKRLLFLWEAMQLLTELNLETF